MRVSSTLNRAGRWFLESGIQEPSGGVARYYCADVSRNKPVSTEITGYTASALVWLYQRTGDEAYLDRARATAHFLAHCAWDREHATFPFEYPSPSPVSHHQTYFFDCGIIIRGLLAVWRATSEEFLIDLALAASRAMVADFHSGQDYHPILRLPGKEPLDRSDQWSRGPGCYQLKAAMAWWDVAEATGDQPLRAAYLDMVQDALRTHREFLPEVPDQYRMMDRLHAYSYFLEALTPLLDRAECAAAFAVGLETAATRLREIAPTFARADVYAQVLRARIYGANAVEVDRAAANEEATALAAFQASSGDPRVDGAFLFGRRDGVMSSHVNPVSTAFALQALEVWRIWDTTAEAPCRPGLI